MGVKREKAGWQIAQPFLALAYDRYSARSSV